MGRESGIGNRVTCVGGPPLALVYQHRPPAELRATVAVCFLVGEVASLLLLFGTGEGRPGDLGWAALLLPAFIGMFARRFRTSRMFVPAVLSSTLVFFVASNLAVWAFSGMYSLDMAGLTACFVAALPFLQYSIAGDLIWSAVLFGGAFLVQTLAQRRAAGTLAHS